MKNFCYAAILMVVFASCRKLPDFDQLTYKPIVVTNHDSTINFSNYKTYYMSDNLTLIGDDPTDTIVPSAQGDQIVKAIADNMASRGFTRTSFSNNADLGINTAVIKVTTTVTYYPPSYWWGYPGYGGCYYGYCGGYYPYYGYGYYSSYTYTTGSLMLQMADLKNVDNVNHRINIVWTNFNTGVLGTSSTQNTQAAVNSVNQAFSQSTYIKTN